LTISELHPRLKLKAQGLRILGQDAAENSIRKQGTDVLAYLDAWPFSQ
jgi:hypothetical protein